MQIAKLAVREQLVKTVVRSGNGGAVWVPRGWLGKEVVVILPERPRLTWKERVVHLLEPCLQEVIAAAIYGSYARGEQTPTSDIDVLVITKGKGIRLSTKEKNIDVTSLSLAALKNAITRYPAIYYQMVREAEPLINAPALEELRNTKPSKGSFIPYLRETKEHLRSNRELLELDKMGGRHVTSYSVLYSAMLRLRGLYITRCILKKDAFSSKKFKHWLLDQGMDSAEFREMYAAYRVVRDDQSTKGLRISVITAEKALHILEKECDALEAELHDQ
ncbi:MAG TPA: DUF2080 family transposase-associated protein [Candidatus Nanoarchaeia archaeon]|nr:DUF2080 family transposase-associated protein [Candidatus Nanoarchaeia archaeon]